MPDSSDTPPARREAMVAWFIFAAALLFFAWGVSVGWDSKRLPGVEYRQAQTALSTYWIKHDRNFSLDYPTPVLGKPWSVPMEFPLYQWSVVATGQATGLGLTKSARLVSIVCFLLSLPALFLWLGRWNVAVGRRGLVLALVVSCPLYIFYARAFMIETMALMFALWFWVAFERTVRTRRIAWLVVAAVAGSGAGLVKVTTLMLYLLPMAAWALVRCWRGRRRSTVARDVRWMAAALAVPVAVTAWWIARADAIKALNPVADFLGSVHMRTFNLGNTQLRLSRELWEMKAHLVWHELTWAPLLAAVFLLPVLGGRHRLRSAAFCALIFASAPVIFPVLYAYHQYYYLASMVMLLSAAGLVIVGLAETGRWRWLASVVTAVVVAGQAYWYGREIYPQQAGTGEGGTALTRVLRAVTEPGDVIVVTGEDWSSITPYYAQRRALMLRGDAEKDGPKLDRAFAELRGETLGAFVVTGEPWQEKTPVLERLAARGFAGRPLLEVAGSWLILPQAREAAVVEAMRMGQVPEARWAPGAEPPPELLAGQWHALADLPRYQRAWFEFMRPAPVRFFTSFEPSLQTMESGAPAFNAHPLVRLVFQLPAGEHELTTALWFNPDAYAAGDSPQSTDGVALEVFALDGGNVTRLLGERVVDPVHRGADRGEVPVRVRFTLAAAGEVEVVVGPGAAGRDTRDWVWLRGPLVIAPVGGGGVR